MDKKPVSNEEVQLLTGYTPDVDTYSKKEITKATLRIIKDIFLIGAVLFLAFNTFFIDKKALLNFAWNNGYNSALRKNGKELRGVNKEVIDSRKWEARIDFRNSVNSVYKINILENWEDIKFKAMYKNTGGDDEATNK